MHIAIGKGRAVVEDKILVRLRVAFANLRVQIVGVPLLEALRFTLDEAGFHGKTGLRQIERVLIIHARLCVVMGSKGRDATNRAR